MPPRRRRDEPADPPEPEGPEGERRPSQLDLDHQREQEEKRKKKENQRRKKEEGPGNQKAARAAEARALEEMASKKRRTDAELKGALPFLDCTQIWHAPPKCFCTLAHFTLHSHNSQRRLFKERASTGRVPMFSFTVRASTGRAPMSSVGVVCRSAQQGRGGRCKCQ